MNDPRYCENCECELEEDEDVYCDDCVIEEDEDEFEE